MAAPDFSKSTVDTLARRARYQCSNPKCGVHTAGPNSDSSKATIIGEAAHIKGAQPDAKRYDPAMSDGERADITNGIWLCRNCHGLVDRDEVRYTVELLVTWRGDHEHRVYSELGAREASQDRSIASIQRDRDVESMRWLMGTLHIPTLQEHINELPRKITDRAIWFHENFCGVVQNALFNVYDPVLQVAVSKLYHGWQRALAHDSEYRDAYYGRYIFSNPGDAPLNHSQQIAWNDIEAGRAEMVEGITAILTHLRSDYLEIDIIKTNSDALNSYINFN